MKIVLNKCFGGFSISKEAAEFMAERGSEIAKKELVEYGAGHWYGFGYVDNHGGYERTDELLILAVETLGKAASGACANLQVMEIPDDIDYFIDNYDGQESVH